MLRGGIRIPYTGLVVLCCLVPLAALIATYSLGVSAPVSVLVAVAILIPLARALLTAAAHPRR